MTGRSPSGRAGWASPEPTSCLGHSATIPNAWQPMETAPRDGTTIAILPKCHDCPERVSVGPMTGKWGSLDEFAEFGEGWVIYEGINAVLFAPDATGWFPLPASGMEARQGGDVKQGSTRSARAGSAPKDSQ